MTRLPVSAEVAARIAARIADYPAAAPENLRWLALRRSARCLAALPRLDGDYRHPARR